MGRDGKEADILLGQFKEAEQKIRILYEISRVVSSLLHLQNVLDAIVDLLVKEFKIIIDEIRILEEKVSKIISMGSNSEVH